MDNTQNVISFCSGYGGLDRGLELAGVKSRTVCYVEIEAFAIANLVAKMETGLLVPAPVWTNLKTFPMEKFRGRVHGITSGYPCQPFSVAGKRGGADDPRHLWPYIRRIYQTIQPRWMFFENVEGHVTLGLSTVISDLEEDGYRVEAGLFTAAEVGAPHRRKRVFILAHSKSNARRQFNGECEDGCEVLGHSKHDGPHRAEIGRSITTPISDDTQRSNTASEFTGASNPRELADTERERLAIGHGKLSECQRTVEASDKQGVANANEQGSQRRNSGELQERAVQWPARPGSPQYDWEEPRVVESGMGRAVNGVRKELDSSYGSAIIKKTHKEDSHEDKQCEETSEQEYSGDSMQEVWIENKTSTASRGLPEADGGCDTLPRLSQRPSCEKRNLGARCEEAESMRCLRKCVYARTFIGKDLLSGMFNCSWKNECKQAMASMKVDRLRLLGNGVVPQQAARAFMMLAPNPEEKL